LYKIIFIQSPNLFFHFTVLLLNTIQIPIYQAYEITLFNGPYVSLKRLYLIDTDAFTENKPYHSATKPGALWYFSPAWKRV